MTDIDIAESAGLALQGRGKEFSAIKDDGGKTAELFLSILCEELMKERGRSRIDGLEQAMDIARLYVGQSQYEQIEPAFEERIALIKGKYAA